MNIDELNKACPDHDRSSCSDASHINAGIDYRYGTTWCRRCEGLHNIRTDARITELEAVITVRDAEIARLNADLELARAEVNRLDQRVDGLRSAIEHGQAIRAITAAPQFIAPKVDDAMCERVWDAVFRKVVSNEVMAELRHAALFLDAWRAELGPQLGLASADRIAELQTAITVRDTEIARLRDRLDAALSQSSLFGDALHAIINRCEGMANRIARAALAQVAEVGK